MAQVADEKVLDVLKKVEDPDLHKDIVSLGFIRNLRICEGQVAFDINLTTPACPVKEKMQKEAQELVEKIPGVTGVNVTMTAEVKQHQAIDKENLKKVRNIIAIGSGKGGVGKSTVAVNLGFLLWSRISSWYKSFSSDII